MKRQMMAGLAVLGLLVTACGSAADPSTREPGDAGEQLSAHNVVMARPAAHIDLSALSNGNRQLGYSLAKVLADEAEQGNLVYSPASLAIAFAMLREGARGQAAADIDRVLHLPADRRTSYNALVTALRTPGPGNVLAVGNGLFIDPALAVRRSYLVALKRWYGAGVTQTAFPSPAIDVINKYVDTNTHGRIPRLLHRLDPNAVFALINTVYLDAKWQSPFEQADTQDAPFTTSAGASVQAHMMHTSGPTDYASGPGWQAVRLPYRGDRLSMWVMLPSAKSNPVDLLSPTTLSAAADGWTRTDVDLSLPRWNLNTRLDLTETLQSMGLDIFGTGDFSGLTPDSGFAIAQVVQQANITVGEKGTVAAAATAIIGDEAAAVPPPDQVTFDADHPFAFAIMDNTTGTPLFEGTVSDPS